MQNQFKAIRLVFLCELNPLVPGVHQAIKSSNQYEYRKKWSQNTSLIFNSHFCYSFWICEKIGTTSRSITFAFGNVTELLTWKFGRRLFEKFTVKFEEPENVVVFFALSISLLHKFLWMYFHGTIIFICNIVNKNF